MVRPNRTTTSDAQVVWGPSLSGSWIDVQDLGTSEDPDLGRCPDQGAQDDRHREHLGVEKCRIRKQNDEYEQDSDLGEIDDQRHRHGQFGVRAQDLAQGELARGEEDDDDDY